METRNYISKTRSTAEILRVLPFAGGAFTIMILVLAITGMAQRYSEWSTPVNLGPAVNSTRGDGGAFLTKDGLNLLFMSNRGTTVFNAPTDLYVSHRESRDLPWEEAVSLGTDINTDFIESFPFLTIDGKFLYFISDRPGGCGNQDIWVARRSHQDGFTEWSEPENLGCVVNSTGPELSPSLLEAEDGIVYLYFSSGLRPEGLGFGDIYVARQQMDGTFGQVSPVSEFNTMFNEIRPKIRERDGLEIFFDSARPGNLADSPDIFVSERACWLCSWGAPVNLGPIVNSNTIDGGPALSFDGTELYFMSDRPGGYGSQDLYLSTRTKMTGKPE